MNRPLLAVVFAMSLIGGSGLGRSDEPKAKDDKPARSPYNELALRQESIAERFAKLERLLSEMAEVEQATNPRRAELLRRAAKQSADRLTRAQLNAIAKQLNLKQLNTAIKNEKEAQEDLKKLLELLTSEDRAGLNKTEQERIKEYIKEVERLIRLEKALQGRTEGGDDAKKLAQEQERVAGRTGDLAKKIQENEEAKPGDGQGKGDGEGKSKGDKEGNAKGASEGKQKGDSEGKQKGDSEGKSKGDKEGNAKGDKEGNSKGDSEGKQKGDSEGKQKGDSEGKSKGDKEGNSKGESEGKQKGDSEGKQKGDSEGKSKGDKEGNSKGDKEGKSKGESEGKSKGDSEGKSKGDSEGKSKGDKEGNSKGDKEGDSKGDSQGDSKGDSEGDSKGQKGGDKARQDENPVRKRIQEAEQKMRDAQQKLEAAKRKEAVEDEEAARKALDEAKKELEEILRQLREEEIERVLAMLEGRFRKMLEMQLKIYETTLELGKTPEDKLTDPQKIRAGELSSDERKIVLECDKALTLLKEEGSSIAFPETVEQMRQDMDQVVERLAAAKVGRITQGIEEDIVRALEEIIAALQKAQRDQDKKKQPPGQPPPPGQEQDQPLVDQLAELKMIKALQLRVNTRTNRYAQLLDDADDPAGQASDQELKIALEKLGEREQRIFRITRDIVLGKNK